MKRLSFIIAFIAATSVAAAQQKPSPFFRNMSADSMTVPAGAVSAAMLASGAAASNLGFTPARAINVMDGAFGAKGDGATDDTAAFAAAIAAVNASAAAGQSACLTIPKGVFYINGATLPSFTQGMGGGVCGAGAWESVIKLGTSYAGDLFSWSDSWMAGVYNAGNTSIATPQKLGPRVIGLTIIGDNSAAAQQNAIVFYDHEDFVFVNDVDIHNLHGRALYAGAMKNDTAAYLRESHFSNIRVFNSGATGTPSIEITSQCSASCSNQDAANSIDISSIDIYGSRGAGFVIRNGMPSNSGVVRGIHLSNIRVEGTEGNTYGATANLLQIGDATMGGKISGVTCIDCNSVSPYGGYYGIDIEGQTPGSTTSIYIKGMVDPGGGSGGGLKIGGGSNINFEALGGDLYPSVTIASSATVGQPIILNGGGYEAYWTYAIDPTSAAFVTNGKGVNSLGSPASYVAPFLAAGDYVTGPARGSYSVDWQLLRWQLTQGATGQNATISGGVGNTASGMDSTVGGGYSSTSSAFGATVSGGIGNTAGGSISAVVGGQNNNASGPGSTALGGNYTDTLGMAGVTAYASGRFAVSGDAQIINGIMRAAASSTVAMRLTADGAAPSPFNTWNLPDNFALEFDLSCVYRDTTNAKAQSWKWLGILMSRGSGAATTAVAAPAATNGQNIGSPGATAPTLSADTTNGGLNISFTAPNSDASHIVCGMSGVVSG